VRRTVYRSFGTDGASLHLRLPEPAG